LKAVGRWLLNNVAGFGIGVLQFALSIILAGVFMATAPGGERSAETVARRLAGDRGKNLVLVAVATVRSVAQGVLGIAVVQSVLAGIGMVAAGVPGAGLWALLVLILAVIQLPPLLVMGPMIIYVFSTVNTAGAIVFMIWAILVSVSDTILKPLFLGRGVEVPMLVILVGAIGGMMATGILGLFVGAVVLAVGYQLLVAWLSGGESAPAAARTAVEGE
jgi:predicted PurR-regulated permease PerM